MEQYYYSMVRAFIAIDLPEDIQKRIGESQKILFSSGARMNAVDPGNLHITLKFLGEISDAEVAGIAGVLREVKSDPFPISVEGIAGNNPRRPRVIWCTVTQGADRCAELHDDVEKLLEPLGIARENRRFTPHITVARVKRFDPSLLTSISTLSQAPFGSCTVRGIVLKQSTLTPDGPIYRNLAEVLF